MTRPLVAVCVLISMALLLAVRPAPHTAHITSPDINAVTQAIEDEIYDYGYQTYGFYYVGQQAGQDATSVRIYINPTLETNRKMGEAGKGLGYVIYKYMPFGEVFRLFWFTKDGLVVLGGNPEFGFPPTHANYLSVYMDDDELRHDKQNWLKASFVIQLHPSAERLDEAAVRQKKRIGYSVRLDPGHRFVPAGRDPRCPVK